jgi:hypothetical protein
VLPELVFGGTDGVGSRFHILCSHTHFVWYRERRVPFLCFALPNSFSAVPTASDPVFIFLLLNLFSAVPRVSGLVFMFCAPGLVWGYTEGVESCFHVLRSWIRFGRYRGRRVPFSCFLLPGPFSTVPRASGAVFIFCALGIIRGRTKGGESRFQVLRSQTRFWRYQGRRVPFSCFAPSDSFWVAPRASGPVFMFCALGLVFSGSEGAGSCFHVLRSRIRLGRYRACRVPLSCFALIESFSTVPRM